MRILNDLISALLLQKNETRSSSPGRGFVPGQELEGTVLGKDGLLDLIDMGGRIVRARSQTPLPPGGRIRVRVLQSGNPVKVRLLSHEVREYNDSGRKAYLDLKASGLKISQAVRLLLKTSDGNTARESLDATKASGLAGLRQIVQGLSVDENTSAEKIRGMVAALASPGRSSSPSLFQNLITQTLQVLSRKKHADDRAEAMLFRSGTNGLRARPGDTGTSIPPRQGHVRKNPAAEAAEKEISPACREKSPVPGKARHRSTDFKLLSRKGLQDKPRVPASPQREAPGEGASVRNKGHAEEASSPEGNAFRGNGKEREFQPTAASGNARSYPRHVTFPGTRGPRAHNMPWEGTPAKANQNMESQQDVYRAGLKDIDRSLQSTDFPGEKPVHASQTPLPGRPIRRQGIKTTAEGRPRQPLSAPHGHAEGKSDAAAQRPAAPASDRGMADRTANIHPGPARIKKGPEVHAQLRAEPIGSGKFSHEPASRSSGAIQGLKTISSHLEAVQQYHPPLIPQDAPFLLIPLWFGRGEGTGHWMWWQEKHEENKENPDLSGHLFFDLDLKSLGPVKIHILSGKPGLSITLWAKESVLSHFRSQLEILLASLNGLGFRMDTVDFFPLEAMDPGIADFSSRDGGSDPETGFHKVT